MLFYNHKHEFIGIDDEGLKLLNYTSLEDLLGVCRDVADLFAKEPGYIHNFKSFGWIDFLLHADSDARSAIVHGNGRTFSCTLEVHNFFLCAEPAQNGYMIEMTHITSISGDDIKPHVITPKAIPESKQTFEPTPVAKEPTPPVKEPIPSALPDYAYITPTTLSEPGTLDVPSYNEVDFESPAEEPIEDIYAKLTLPLSDEELHEEILPEKPVPLIHPTQGGVHYSAAEKEFLNNLKVDKSYVFDPNVAAHELGLPVDLIQEFIGDFIQQSHEFKEELFEAVLKGDSNNIKILSHKLKGVAANLRIEDAFEALSIINTSSDPVEIEANLKYFYTIISKLEGNPQEPAEEETLILEPKTVEETPKFIAEPEAASTDDIYAFALKDNTFEESKKEPIELESLEFSEPLTDMGLPEIETAVMAEDDENSIMDLPPASLHYDKISIAGQLGIEHDFFDELIEEYKRDAFASAQEISAAISAFDTHAWKRAASHLKGISDNLRLNEISDELAILSQTNDAQEAHKASKRLNSFLEQL